jgi:hypothetical protein
VEHIRLLRARGHHTIAVHRSASASRAMPPWTTQEADADVVLSLHQRLADVYPVQDIDVVVVGIFHQVGVLPSACTQAQGRSKARKAAALQRTMQQNSGTGGRCHLLSKEPLAAQAKARPASQACTRQLSADVAPAVHQQCSGVRCLQISCHQDAELHAVSVLQVAELLAGCPAPVLYWEQGHEWVFGDPIRLQVSQGAWLCHQLPLIRYDPACDELVA